MERYKYVLVIIISGLVMAMIIACADNGDDDGASGDDDDACAGVGEVDEYGLTWVTIPGGTFMMGCSPGDTECQEDEFQRHEVTISSFMMTKTEITQKQFSDNGGHADASNNFAGCDECPRENLPWHYAHGFCESLGARLPTEAEWEYTARAGTTTRFYCGDDEACLEEIAWYADNAEEQTHPVGGKLPNDFCLYDMLGNVTEVVNDNYAEDYYENSPAVDPPGPASGDHKVARGGDMFLLYSASTRGALLNDIELFNYNIGFRCARDIE